MRMDWPRKGRLCSSSEATMLSTVAMGIEPICLHSPFDIPGSSLPLVCPPLTNPV